MRSVTPFFAFALLGLSACATEPLLLDAPPQAVRVQEVRLGTFTEGRAHLASVVPAQTVRVLAQVPGTVVALGPAEGVAVQRGELLTRISAPDVAARAARVGAERRRAERERDFACDQYATDQVLARSGDLASIQLDRSEKGCVSGQHAVDAAKAAEREVAVSGTRSKESTPFDGQVLNYLVDVGQTVMPGTPLARYGSEGKQLRLQVVSGDLVGIAAGTRVVTSSGDGRVVEIGAQAQGAGRLYDVLVEMDAPTGLRVGQTLRATLVLDEWADASAAPESAIGSDDEGNYLLVEDGAVVQRVPIDTGPHQDGWVAFTPSLPAGTRVVTGALADVRLGTPVLAVEK